MIENNWYIYSHIREDKNEVFYIGIGKTKNFARAYEKSKRNNHWKNIVKNTKFLVNILYSNLTREEANTKEKELISLYGRSYLNQGPLCNITVGGEGGSKKGRILSDNTKKKISIANSNMSSETKKKMSLAASNRIVSDETKKKLSKIFSGRKLSDETKNKISLANRNISDEKREKLRIASTGRIFSDESKEKMKNSQLNKKLSEETKRKISESCKNRVLSKETIEKMKIAAKKRQANRKLKNNNQDVNKK